MATVALSAGLGAGLSAGLTKLRGGSWGDAAKSGLIGGALGGVTAGVGSLLGAGAGAVTGATTSTTTGTVTGAAASTAATGATSSTIGAASSTIGKQAAIEGVKQAAVQAGKQAAIGAVTSATSTAIQGGSVGDIAKSAAVGGAVGGTTSVVTSGVATGVNHIKNIHTSSQLTNTRGYTGTLPKISNNIGTQSQGAAQTAITNTIEAPLPGSVPTLKGPIPTLKGKIQTPSEATPLKDTLISAAKKINVGSLLAIGAVASQGAADNSLSKMQNELTQSSLDMQKRAFQEQEDTKKKLKADALTSYQSSLKFGEDVYKQSQQSAGLLTSYTSNYGGGTFSLLNTGVSSIGSKRTDMV